MATRKPQSQPIRISTSAKCAQCSMRIEAGDLVVFMHGDLFHRACWRILVSYVRIEESAKLRWVLRVCNG